MLEALKFVKGAVATKDFVPELTHFCIKDGYIKGYNGSIALASPIDLALEATPKAIPFIKAIEACKESTSMHITPTGRLSIRSGKFKAFVECTEGVYPELEPEGERIALDTDFMEALATAAPFMAEDASRPWARGVLIDGQTLTATNNIVIVQFWLETAFPVRVNIPHKAVKELLRVKEAPTHISMSEDYAIFYYADGRWLRTALIDLDWPDINKVLDRDSNPAELPDWVFPNIPDLIPFTDEVGRLILTPEGLFTSVEEGVGASYEADGLKVEKTILNAKLFLSLEKIIETIDLYAYPQPCLFYGNGMRGAIVGIR
ncbi:DNA polymerase beta subunit [Shewanella phage S0112]|nr:DNA polymerase beta subunit [Shewanella phage S0112]